MPYLRTTFSTLLRSNLNKYDKADKYYTSVGNREAACYSAYLNVKDANDKAALDSLIARYGDLPICGSVAVAKV